MKCTTRCILMRFFFPWSDAITTFATSQLRSLGQDESKETCRTENKLKAYRYLYPSLLACVKSPTHTCHIISASTADERKMRATFLDSPALEIKSNKRDFVPRARCGQAESGIDRQHMQTPDRQHMLGGSGFEKVRQRDG
eukprot:637825-Pleurochrysis_carterae.AAC.1